MWWLFAQLYKNSTDCFMLEVSTVSTFQKNRIYIACQEKENKILHILANEEMGTATFDSS